MKKLMLSCSLLFVLALSACTEDPGIKCGAGTVFEDGTCVAPDVVNCADNETLLNGECVIDEPLECQTGYHLVDGTCELIEEEPEECNSNEVLENGVCVLQDDPEEIVDPSALELLGTNDFTDPDLSKWGTEGSVTLSHDENGYLVANVPSLTDAFYSDNLTIGDLVTENEHTYTVTIVAKTDIENTRDVMFFLEDTDQGYLKFFMETETLTNEFQTFSYTYVATSNNNDTKLGVFLGNMENAATGNIIIDSILITKQDGLQGTYVEELENADFSTSDLSNWITEGNVTVSYDEEGYMVINVLDYTGNFWEENVTYGNLIAEAWTTYTITITIKSSVDRNIIVFAEDTDAGYAKYVEETHSVTTDWTTIQFSFKPLATNADTKIGLFLGNMENASLGEITIDSIVITAQPTFE